MIPNVNDGSARVPRLRCDISGGTLLSLPPESAGPSGTPRQMLLAARAAGFEGIQGGDRAVCEELMIPRTTSGRVDRVGQADALAAGWADEGYECSTLHVGSGMEDDDAVDRIVEDICRAADRRRFGLYIETHRATVTQDMFRTVRIARRFPEVRFNGDFSHYYTGQEMVYGDWAAKLEFLRPVFERVRFMHGRIGNPGCIQVDVGDGTGRTYVEHFRQMWTRACAGFLNTAGPGDILPFAVELLPAGIFYARTFAGAEGRMVEESDRWEQSIVLARIARECFEGAAAGLTSRM